MPMVRFVLGRHGEKFMMWLIAYLFIGSSAVSLFVVFAARTVCKKSSRIQYHFREQKSCLGKPKGTFKPCCPDSLACFLQDRTHGTCGSSGAAKE